MNVFLHFGIYACFEKDVNNERLTELKDITNNTFINLEIVSQNSFDAVMRDKDEQFVEVSLDELLGQTQALTTFRFDNNITM